MWQADTLYGPYVQIEGVAVQTRLIAFLDDASPRLLSRPVLPGRECRYPHRGPPRRFLQTRRAGLLCTSITAPSTPPRKSSKSAPASAACSPTRPCGTARPKEKSNDFFAPSATSSSCRELDLSSLEALNRQFTHWVEEHYNAQIHSVLGMSPLDRFALDRNRVRFLPPNEANDELFFVEEERHVRADNTFSFQAVRFEAPRHLPDRTIQVRFERKAPTRRVVVYYKGERMGEARPLDAIANDRPPKSRQVADPGQPPPGARSGRSPAPKARPPRPPPARPACPSIPRTLNPPLNL